MQQPALSVWVRPWFQEGLWPIWALLMLLIGVERNGLTLVLSLGALLAVVLSSVSHAERISERIGEPFGALVLALAVTVIEVSIVLAVMLRTDQAPTLARDTIFSAVMLIFTAMIGLTLLMGGMRFRTVEFDPRGVLSALLVLTTISVLTLILPNYTNGAEGPFYTTPQLILVSVVTIMAYGAFLFVQNFKHREDFQDDVLLQAEEPHRSGRTETVRSAMMLPLCLVGVVGLAETLAHSFEDYLHRVGASEQVAGLALAAVVLLPEGIASLRAAGQQQFQRSLNLSLGSALASISLTIPVVAFFSLWKGLPMALGIGGEEQVLFLLSLLVLILSLGRGRTHILHGLLLLLLFAVFLFLSIF
ncbi:ionic transporter y4hA [bacterium]|nr:ionic transporter y4hA [bacterium]